MGPVHREATLTRPAVPRVSILLPCRDAAEHLPDAIASIEAQTLADFEVVAVDDGSADATGALLRSWCRRDARVRVHTTAGIGLVAALSEAAADARGELLARMDADDIAAADRLAAQVALLDARADIAACGTHVRYFPSSIVRAGARRYERWLNALSEPDELERDIYVECPIAHPTLMVRRAAFDGAGGYRDAGWPEDYDLVLRLRATGGRLANVPRVLHDWREGSHRLSRRAASYSADAFRRCKVHYLRRDLGERPLVVCGAGPIGKAFARAWLAAGGTLCAFVDVDPRKIGQRVYDVPVIGHAELPAVGDAYAVAAVGSEQGRATILAELGERGWREVADFRAVA
jgi:glycosyltransferase involved in cell wall biosynthesis